MNSISGAFQTRDHTYLSEKEVIRNGTGESVAKIYYDPTQEATFTYVATGASGGAVSVTVPTIGDFATVTDNGYTAIAATTWLVDEVSTAGSNTGAVRVTVKLTKYPSITS
jgi:hypothetical protein